MKGLCGRVVTLKTRLFSGGVWGINETEAWVTPQMLMGKVVPIDGLKAGDEVLVKEHYDPDFGSVPEQLDLRGTVAIVDRIDHLSGVDNIGIVHAIINGVRYLPEARFVGKLIRIPTKE